MKNGRFEHVRLGLPNRAGFVFLAEVKLDVAEFVKQSEPEVSTMVRI
jgi:hypothetical protein